MNGRRKWWFRLPTLLMIGAAILCPAETPPRPLAPPDWRPLLEKPLPDPFVFEDEGRYYITGTAPYGFHGPALRRELLTPFELSIDYGELGGPFQHWGFKFFRHTDGRYHAYATIHFGHFVTAVAHLVPRHGQTWQPGRPISAWRVNRVLAGDREGRTGFAYDAAIEQDAEGRLFLIYNYSAKLGQDVHIMAQRMKDPATPDPAFPPRRILGPEGFRSEDRNPGFIQITEATNISRVQGKFVLFYSVGDFALHHGKSNYKLGVAYSETLIPPAGEMYRKVLLPDPDHLWGSQDSNGMEVGYLLQSEHPEWPNYCADYVVGPGLGSLVQADGRDWLVFHGYRPGRPHDGPDERYAWKLPVQFNLRGETPALDWIRPVPPLPTPRAPEDAGK